MAFVASCLDGRRQRWATGLNASLIRSFDRRHTSIDEMSGTMLLVIDHFGCVDELDVLSGACSFKIKS